MSLSVGGARGVKEAATVVSSDLARIVDDLTLELEALAGGTLLITGGAGFLGYYLVQVPLRWNERHPSRRIDVVVYDNFRRGAPAWLAELGQRPDLAVHEVDMRGPLPGDMPAVDHIIHAAGIASPAYYRAHPIETMDANITGLRNLLERAEVQARGPRPVQNFLFFSSSEIYGDPEPSAIPTGEDYPGRVSSTGPRACYDESKRYGETLCVNFTRARGVRTTIARPFNNYGPGMKITDGRVIADFGRSIVEGRDIVMYSDGSPTRTFCYVSDAITGYYKVLTLGRSGEAYNIGTPGPEVSIRDLANRIAGIGREHAGYTGKVVTGVNPEQAYLVDNPNRRCPDISKAVGELRYRPRVALDDGLLRTVYWYQEHGEGEEK